MQTNNEMLEAMLRKQPQPSSVAQSAKQTKHRKSTAVFRGDTVDSFAVSIVRLLMLGVLFLSCLGTVVAINGGWLPFRPESIAIGIALQALLTLIQWWKRRDKISIAYLFSLGIDALMTYLGFQALVVPFFVAGLAKLNIATSSATIVSVAVTGILSVTVAVLPEQVLID